MSKIWAWFSGKKRTIALIYWSVVVPSMMVIWPEGYPQGFPLVFSKIVTIFGLLLSALGLGHAAVKSMASKKASQTTEEEQENAEVEEVKEEKTQPIENIEENKQEAVNATEDKKDSNTNS